MNRPQGWDRSDPDEWAPVSAAAASARYQTATSDERYAEDAEPRLPGVRPWVVVVAFALIVAAGVVGVLCTTPGVVNGAVLLVFLLGVAGIGLVVREIRR